MKREPSLLLAAIHEGEMAGAYRALAKEFPNHAGGLLRMAETHSRRATELLGVIADAA